MIVDVHSHLTHAAHDFDTRFIADARRARGDGHDVGMTVRWEDYRATSPAGTVAIVFGGKARRSGMWVDDAKIAEHVASDPDHLIGFLAVDPTQDGWQDELRFGHQELGLRGIKIMPMYAGFDPADPAYDELFTYAESHGLPILAHTGTTFVANARLEYARPVHFDEVGIRHPDLAIVLAHLSHPYEGECIAIIRKHPNIYADVSALHYRPFQLWHSLRLIQDYGVWDKVLFGSDYPFTTVNDSVDGLRGLATVPGIPGLPSIDSDAVESVIFRDTLPLLGLA